MTYLKFGAIGLLILVLFGGGWYCGSRASKTALEGFQAAQSANTAKAVLAERASAATELTRVKGIVETYEDAQLSPIIPGIATRVLERACPASGTVSSVGNHPGPAVTTSPEPGGDPGAQRLLQAVFDACAQDASELTALQEAWPR